MVPDAKVFARFPDGESEQRLFDMTHTLIAQQKEAWPACKKGFLALEAAEKRSLDAAGFPVFLQWNPQRIVSTAAKVDAASIQARRCFLCLENLPEEQVGIVYRDDYLVLCNPSPIFPFHYTVTHREHRPQRILDGIDSFLGLARDLGEGFVTFYNGPKCGASAPDHLHFQAVSSGSIPAEADVRNARKKDRLTDLDGVEVWKIPFYGRTHCILSGNDTASIAGAFRRILSAWEQTAGLQDEPMLNLLCFTQDDMTSLLLFLRSKHRPDDYFKEAEEHVLVSPASVDMGGHIVTPVEKDYRTIDGPYIEHMYNEVSAPSKLVSDIVHAL